jgi:MFS family permease
MDFIRRQANRINGLSPNLKLFLIGMALMGIATGLFDTTFNNFLSDTFDITAKTRGYLEFPRELPGFLCALFAGVLFFLPETRIASGAAMCVGLSMFGMAVFGGTWSAMIVMMILWSLGAHLTMPVRSAIGMSLAHENQKGKRLGQIKSISTAAMIIGCLIVWISMKYMSANYRVIFIIAGITATAAAVVLYFMRLPEAHLQRPKYVFKKEYWLYYTLEFLYGARKQIFITFGPWVLVRIFNQPAYVFAQLFIVASVLGVFFHPWLGRAIDRFGERTILVCNSICIFLICAGYGFAHLLPNQTFALWLLYACLVFDNLLFSVHMARDTYISKIAKTPKDISPTLSMGISINHVVSMSVPALGGIMWWKYGHSSVFIASAGVAVLMCIFSSLVRIPKRYHT